MTNLLRILTLLLLVALSPTFLAAQDCGCTQCDVPIIANYDRTFSLFVGSAGFNDLSMPQQGVCSVEIDFAHDFLSDLDIWLTSPYGQTVQLVADPAPNDTTWFSRWKVRFLPCGQTALPDAGQDADWDANLNWPAYHTFTGDYYPAIGCLEDFAVGTVNGNWELRVRSQDLRSAGFIYGFKINFCQPQGIQCEGLKYPAGGGENCWNAEPLPANITEFVGNTESYQPSGAQFPCGTIENDQWFVFTAACEDFHVEMLPGYCISGNGLQLALYDDCFEAPIACQGGASGGDWLVLPLAATLTIGQTYYLMIDGYAGDQCDFIFYVPPGCASGDLTPPVDTTHLHGCPGVTHTLGLLYPVFGAVGYIWEASGGALVNGQVRDTVVGPGNLNVDITWGDANSTVCVAAYNFTTQTDFICVPLDVDTPKIILDTAIVCYDNFPYHWPYDYDLLPDIYAAGTYNYTLHDFWYEGMLYSCADLTLVVMEAGSIVQDEPLITLQSQYALPDGQVAYNSGTYHWWEDLPGGCYNIHQQPIYFVRILHTSDGCAPDTVFVLGATPAMLVSVPGASPDVFSGIAGSNKLIYASAGSYDLSINFNGQDYLFEDYLTLNLAPATMAAFTLSADQNVLTFSNQSQNATAYSWNFGDGQTSTETEPIHTYTAPGTYLVKLTATGPCGSKTTQQAVAVNGQLPHAGFGLTNNFGCGPLTVQFTDQSLGSPTTWAWQFPGGNPATSSEANPTVIYTQPGLFPVTLTIQNVFGENTATQPALIEVLPAPMAAFSFNAQQNAVVFSNQSQNATDLSWDFGDDQASLETNPSHTYALPGTYEVTLTATGVCGSATATQTVVVVGQLPQAAFTADNPQDCGPLTVQFADHSAGNPTAWAWQFPGGDPATSSEVNPTVTYAQPGLFPVTLTIQNVFGENTATQPALIEVLPAPTADFSFAAQQNAMAFSSQIQNATDLSWDFGDGQTSLEENPNHLYAAPGIYEVTLTATGACGSATVTKTVVVGGQLPQAGFTADNPQGCGPLSVQFTDQSLGDPISWAWHFPGGDPATSSETNPTVTYTQPGTYSATLTIQNIFGENTVTQTSLIEVLPATTADFSFDAQQNLVAFSSQIQNATDWYWDFGDGQTSFEENPVHIFAASGSHIVLLTASGPCGSVTVSHTVSISGQAPTSVFSVENNVGCAPLTVQFTNQSVDSPISWQWVFPGGNPAASTDPNPTVTYTMAGTYDAMLVVQNAFGADTLTQTAIVEVAVLPTVGFEFIANQAEVAFTNQSQNGLTQFWDFGDGNTSTEADPVHTYMEPGTYLVTLQVTNACGIAYLEQVVNITIVAAHEPSSVLRLLVSPNPSDGHFQVTIQGLTAARSGWRVCDVLGRALSGGEWGAFVGQATQAVDISHLPTAVYLLEVWAGPQRAWLRVVKP